MEELKTIFDVTMVRDYNWKKPHYPSYEVRTEHVGTSSSLKGAESLIRDYIGLEVFDTIHHFNVREVPLDSISHTGENLSEWLYDRTGSLIDSRPFSNMRDDLGVYPGRTPEQIRFKEGDIVEVQRGNEIYLSFVVALPPSVERANGINANTFFHLDDTDDSYTVLTEEDYRSHDHVSSLKVFKPAFKIHPGTEKRLRTAYENYLTSEMRDRIAMTTALERIRQLMSEYGLDCEVEPFYFEYVFIKFPNRLENGKTMVIRIDTARAFGHLDRVLLTLHRFAGHPQPGRGYSLHDVGENPNFSEEHIFEMR